MKHAAQLLAWRRSPASMVRELFHVEPDVWQEEVLETFPTSPRTAMKACKGPGKTAVLSWLAWNFLLTRPHPKVAATSITADNLADGLWTEMAKWQGKCPLLKEKFEWTKTRIFSKESPETWWMSSRTWPKSADATRQADTLAGLHADYLLFILDEAGGIPDGVMASAEAGLSTGTEAHLLMAGNPTHTSGPLYRACTSERHQWKVIEITGDPDDPKRSTRVSVAWAQKQIDTYGRDNPWVLVNVFGRFPPASLNSLIGPDEVRDAMLREMPVEAYQHAARILGVDVAREGDDRTVIFPRQGLMARFPNMPVILRNEGGMQVAGRLAMESDRWGADAQFVDNTGGFGAGVIDAMLAMKRTPIGVHFSSSPLNAGFVNKRAEMIWLAVEWVKNGGALPNLPELVVEMTAPTYFFKDDKIQIEAKAQVKERIGVSPDLFDAFALTFAYPVQPRSVAEMPKMRYGRQRSKGSAWAQ